jgi:hypothetical protein
LVGLAIDVFILELMKDWTKTVWKERRLTPAERMTKSYLLMDSYVVHLKKTYLASLSHHYNTKAGIVPAGMTPLLQGIDTHVNKSLKCLIKKKYKIWMREETPEYTKAGNKKGEFYDKISLFLF